MAGVRAGMTVIAVPDPRFAPNQALLDQAHLVLNSLTEFSLDTITRLAALNQP